jgi:hypothetical protein
MYYVPSAKRPSAKHVEQLRPHPSLYDGFCMTKPIFEAEMHKDWLRAARYRADSLMNPLFTSKAGEQAHRRTSLIRCTLPPLNTVYHTPKDDQLTKKSPIQGIRSRKELVVLWIGSHPTPLIFETSSTQEVHSRGRSLSNPEIMTDFKDGY